MMLPQGHACEGTSKHAEMFKNHFETFKKDFLLNYHKTESLVMVLKRNNAQINFYKLSDKRIKKICLRSESEENMVLFIKPELCRNVK